jgi:hypothetical protein
MASRDVTSHDNVGFVLPGQVENGIFCSHVYKTDLFCKSLWR